MTDHEPNDKCADKYHEEIRFWREEFDRYFTWLAGGVPDMYGVPAPDYRARNRVAVDAWCRADRSRYGRHLFMESDAGEESFGCSSVAREPWMRVGRLLDVGCGPLGLARFMCQCSTMVYGLDPLWGAYEQIGYEVDLERAYPITGRAEQGRKVLERLPEGVARDRLQQYGFDAIVSVNAIDHVDDFDAAIQGIADLLADGGLVRIECHYHEPEPTEPHRLTDARVGEAFRLAGLEDVEKVSDVPFSYFYPPGYRPESDRLTVWSNFTTGLEVFCQ